MKKVAFLIFAFVSLILFASISKPILSKETADTYVYLPIIQKPANPYPYWSKVYNGQAHDATASTKDGGTLVLSPDGSNGFALAKLNADGEPLWEKTGLTVARPQTVIELDDGNIMIAGESNYNLWVAKLSSTGTLIWQKRYLHGDRGGNAFALTATNNGGAAVAGDTYGDSYTDYWILNLDQNGTVIWQKTFGGIEESEVATVIQSTPDNGFIIAGDHSSFSSKNGTWIIKLNSQGNMVWQKIIKDFSAWSRTEYYIHDLAVTPDGNSYYIGTIIIVYGSEYIILDRWVFKLDSAGNLAWSKTFDIAGSPRNIGESIFATDNNNIYISGGSLTAQYESQELLFNLDNNGTPRWHKTYDHDILIQHVDSQFITLSGSLNSDFMLAKSNLGGDIPGCAATTQPAIGVEDIETPIQTTNVSVNSPVITISDTTFSVSGSTFPNATLVCGG